MNWVGGSRTRVLIKQERRKQKEYFEKNRLKAKMKLLGVLSPVKSSAVSLDLLNLYIVNQISCKKKILETVRKPTHVNMNRDITVPLRKHDVELPMSPHCTPSKLCIDDIENNMHYQGLGNKEELDPVQLSQDKGSYGTGIFEPQFSKIQNYSYMPQNFSAEFSPNTHVPKQHFTLGTVLSPWEVGYEEKQTEQLSKLTGSQDVSPSYKPAQFGKRFERLNSPGNGNLVTERSALITGEERGCMNERRQSHLIAEKQSVQHTWGKNGKELSPFLGVVNQPAPVLLSENCDPFVSQNMINLLSIDQQKMSEMFGKCRHDGVGDTCVIAGSDQNPSADRGIRSIFTVPELPLSKSTFHKTSYPEKGQAREHFWKEYSDNRVSDLCMPFEKNCYPPSSEKQGKLGNDCQGKMPQKSIQRHAENSVRKIPLEELPSEQPRDFQHSQILMEERGIDSLQDRPTSVKKIYLDSSSQSSSYSPRPTDSCFSSSSEMPSEEEDQMLQQMEDSNMISIKPKETSNNYFPGEVAELSRDEVVKAEVDKLNENFHPFLVKHTEESLLSRCSSAPVLLSVTNGNSFVQVARCDAEVQTENELELQGKADAAIQCDRISACACGRNLSPLCSANTAADTTGGQRILNNS
nr:uncharacterized protein C12orf40 homolog isoform X2 [Oryctolagus cuniculus]